MAHRPTLAEFVEQELRLAESTFAAVVDEVLKRWHDRAPLQRQSAELQALRVLQAQRGDFMRCALQSLHEQAALKAERPGSRTRRTGKLELSLVDDDEVTADIEVARVVERCDADLEDPIRELRTYTSALAGDVNAARDTNPLRPEVWVRAVLAGAQGVAMARPQQLELLRTGTPALLRSLHERYQVACQSLQAAGVTPASHRTIVNEGVVTELTEAMRARRSSAHASDPYGGNDFIAPAASRPSYRQAAEAPAQAVRTGRTQRSSPSRSAASSSLLPSGTDEHHHVERLSQLYDAVLSDRRLPRDSLPLLSRLYPAVLRQTLNDPRLLDDPTHAVWSLIDHVAFLVQTREVGDSKANVAFANGLVEQLVGQSTSDARAFQSAANRLAVLERQRFARAVAAAASDIATLTSRDSEAHDSGAPSVPQALDAASTDSQPAPLLRRGADAQRAPEDVASAWRAGSWLTIFLRRRWRRALVLWRAPSPGPLLLLDADEARPWALRVRALERLAAEGLARTFGPRSLLSDATTRIAQPGLGTSVTSTG
jgi:hypothetical protein